ncbi:MAG: multiheme c-type cytochrome [Planctomycetota bacterium]
MHDHLAMIRFHALRRPGWLPAAGVVLLLGAGCRNDPMVFPELQLAISQQGYVGSQRCGLCHGPFRPAAVHPTYHADWAASAHGMTGNTTPGEQTIVADRNGDGVTDFRDGLDLGGLPEWTAYTPAGGASGALAPVLGFHAATGTYSVTIGSRTFDVQKVLGIGRGLQTYLTVMGGSRYVLPVAYRVVSGTWEPLLPENWYVWNDTNLNGSIDNSEAITGLLYPTGADTPVTAGRTGDSWERNCAGCHVTGLTSVVKNAAAEFIADFNEEGVGCEACHGPGGLHADNLGGRGLPDRAILNPSRLTALEQRDLCMSCHTRGTSAGTVGGDALRYPWRLDGSSFVPGQALADALTIAAGPQDPVHELQGNRLHLGQPCQVCHSAHDTTNLARVRMTVPTPNSGDQPVVFTARSGPPGSGGLMGDATDGTFTAVCEVCHTQTDHFRNDGSEPSPNHHDGEACTDCHQHSRGFIVSESTGGITCSACHNTLSAAMGVVTAETRHLLDNTDPVYPTDETVVRCLTCHVDHDIFGPGAGGVSNRGANLRTDISVVPTVAAGFANTDFIDSGSGGICLSCHTVSQAKSYTRPDGSTQTPPVPFDGAVAAQVAAYQAGVHGGTFTVPSDFSGGGTRTFLADCSKCHNDDLVPKSGVGGQAGPHEFGLHKSSRGRMLSPLGFGGAADPLEEEFCFRCHSTVTDAVGGTAKPSAGADWYDVEPMSARAEDLWAAFGATYGHPVAAQRGRHSPIEGAAPNWNPAASRHVECEDCHNPHAAGPSRTFDTSGLFAQPQTPSNLAAGTPLGGVWGVDVPTWPAAWTAPDPATEYSRLETSTYTWQVCLKCHSGYAYGASPPAGGTDQAREFNPNNPSYHAVVGASKTTFPPDTSFVSPWTRASAMSCSDCHTADSKTGAQGPHGSAHRGILAGSVDSTTGQTGTEAHLCFKCHSFDVYALNASAGGAATGFSSTKGKNLHTFHMGKNHFTGSRKVTCFDCHAAVPHGWHRRSLLVVTTDPAPYNNGGAGLSPLDVAGWPASGNWEKKSCNNAACH